MSDENYINAMVGTNSRMAKELGAVQEALISLINRRIKNVQGDHFEIERLTEAIKWVHKAAPADLLQYTELVADEAEKTGRIPSPN